MKCSFLFVLVVFFSCNSSKRVKDNSGCQANTSLTKTESSDLFHDIYDFHKNRMVTAAEEKRISPELYDLYSDGLLALYLGLGTENTEILDKLIDLLSYTIRNTQTKSELDIPMGGYAIAKTSKEPFKVWTTTTTSKKFGKITYENLLNSSLHVFLLSNVTSEIARNEKYSKRYKGELIEYSEFLTHILSRWVYKFPTTQFNGWGCTKSLYSFQTALTAKSGRKIGTPDSKSYCNGITDQDILITGASTLFTDINTQKVLNELGFSPDEEEIQTLRSFSTTANRIILGRIIFPKIRDRKYGFQFDPMSWIDHPDWSVSISGKASQDISHSRRIFHLLVSYKRNNINNIPIDINSTIEAFANQLYFYSYNKDKDDPKFSNFLSGDNSVYRLNYRGMNDKGIKANGLSHTILPSGYLALENIIPEFKSLRRTILNSNTSLNTYKLCHQKEVPEISVKRAKFYFEANRHVFK